MLTTLFLSAALVALRVSGHETYSAVDNYTTSAYTTTTGSSGALESIGPGNVTETSTIIETSTLAGHYGHHGNRKTRINAWAPTNGLFFVDVDKMEKTQAYVTDGVTILYATGKATAPGLAKPTKVADFRLYYEKEMIEGVALLDDQGIPTEMVDALSCKIRGKTGDCLLVDWDGSTIASTKTTKISGKKQQVKATKLSKKPKFYKQGVVPNQAAIITYDGVYNEAPAAQTT